MTSPRFLLIAALSCSAAVGCTDSIDERPATFEYMVAAVLAPSCGTATCHNTMTKREGYAFDTVDAARQTFRDQFLVPVGGSDEPDTTKLISIVTIAAGDEFIPRMPIDSPLPDADVELMRRWIVAGAVMP